MRWLMRRRGSDWERRHLVGSGTGFQPVSDMGWKPMLRKPTGWKPVLRRAGARGAGNETNETVFVNKFWLRAPREGRIVRT